MSGGDKPQPTLLEQLQDGLDAHRRGDLTNAELRYRAVLAAAPDTLDACNLLSRLLVQTGRAADAAALLRRTIDRTQDQVGLWLSFVEALLASSQFAEARGAAEKARRLAPADQDVLYAWAEAQRHAGAWEMAAGAYRQILGMRPDHAACWLQLATCLQAMGDLPGAMLAAQRALTLVPQAPECHNNLGNLLVAAGDHTAALARFEQALRLRPDYPAALINKGAALRELGRAEEAVPVLERAIAVGGGQAEAHAALALARHNLGDLDGALASYATALAKRPDDAETHWNCGLARLAQGDFRLGWEEFRWRWRKTVPPLPRRSWPWPRWSGGDLAGKRILVWGEQGLGDRLLFLQFMPRLLAAGALVTLEADPRLIPLLERGFPGVEFVPEGTEPASDLLARGFDAQIPVGDLAAGPPPGLAILAADLPRSAALAATYRAGSGDKLVGLSWRSGNPTLGAAKSLKPEDFASLAYWANARFVCLQYGATDAEHGTFRAILGERYIHDPAIDAMTDLDGLASQIAGLDEIVTVSNVTAHLAGALGRPVQVLAPEGKSLFFYLMRDGQSTPWYPTMRILRRPAGTPWSSVLESAAGWPGPLAKSGRGC